MVFESKTNKNRKIVHLWIAQTHAKDTLVCLFRNQFLVGVDALSFIVFDAIEKNTPNFLPIKTKKILKSNKIMFVHSVLFVHHMRQHTHFGSLSFSIFLSEENKPK